MGDGDVSNNSREKLERDLDIMQASLKQTNEKNKPPPPKKKKKHGFGRVLGAVVNVATNVAAAALAANAGK